MEKETYRRMRIQKFINIPLQRMPLWHPFKHLPNHNITKRCSYHLCNPKRVPYTVNTGVLELCRVHDPRVVRLVAVYAAVLSFVPKFAAIISTMPVAIVGGVSFIFYSLSVVDKHFLTFMFTMDIQINLK